MASSWVSPSCMTGSSVRSSVGVGGVRSPRTCRQGTWSRCAAACAPRSGPAAPLAAPGGPSLGPLLLLQHHADMRPSGLLSWGGSGRLRRQRLVSIQRSASPGLTSTATRTVRATSPAQGPQGDIQKQQQHGVSSANGGKPSGDSAKATSNGGKNGVYDSRSSNSSSNSPQGSGFRRTGASSTGALLSRSPSTGRATSNGNVPDHGAAPASAPNANTTPTGSATSSSRMAGSMDVTMLPGGEHLPWRVDWQLPPTAAASWSWSVVDRGALVKQAALERSGWEEEDFEQRYAELVALLPDLPHALPRVGPKRLLAAMSDLHATAGRLILLKGQLPETNVGAVLLLHPRLLTWSQEELMSGVGYARRVLGGARVAEEVVQWYPSLLEPAVLDGAMRELRRLVPHLLKRGPDPRELVHLLGIVMAQGGAGRGGVFATMDEDDYAGDG